MLTRWRESLFTYCDFKTYRFVPDLPVDHGGLQEGTEEEELVYFPSGALVQEGEDQ